MNNAHWEHFEHEADIGIRGIGATLDEAFEQAGLAMSAVITDITMIRATTTINISCCDDSIETLFYDWLNALVYEMGTRKMLFSRFEISINHGRLSARVGGEAIDIHRHQPAVEIKGATYTALAVYRREGHWVAQCVVDV